MTELIGVVAVIAIIAAVLLPVAIRRIDYAAKQREITDGVAISNALALQILSTRTIPSETTWAQAAANWTSLPVTKITTTPRRYARAFLIDTSGWLSTNLGSAGSPTQYVQTAIGTTNRPTNGRLLLISTIARALPTSVLTNSRPSAADFAAMWDTAENAIPGGFASGWAGWGGRGEDLVIQRINLEPLFHKLVLMNRDPYLPGLYSIQPDSAVTNVPPAVRRTGYFLDGTDLTLILPDGVVQERVPLTRDESYAFSGNRWTGDYFGSGSTDDNAESFAYWAFRFMKAGAPLTAQQGATTEGVVAAMYDFMLVFSLWANKCFDDIHFAQYGSGPESTTVPEYELLLDIAGGGTKTDSSFLNDFSGEGGLLNKP